MLLSHVCGKRPFTAKVRLRSNRLSAACGAPACKAGGDNDRKLSLAASNGAPPPPRLSCSPTPPQLSSACHLACHKALPRSQQTLRLDTAVYTAPEVLLGASGQPSPAADVYSLGVLLHEVRPAFAPLVTNPC